MTTTYYATLHGLNDASLHGTAPHGTAVRNPDGTVQFTAEDGTRTVHPAAEVTLCGQVGLTAPRPTVQEVAARMAHPAPAPAPTAAPLPEAPASANVHIELPGVGRVQLTARGQNGTQVVADLLVMVHAARALAAEQQALDAAEARDEQRLERLEALRQAWLPAAEARGRGCAERLERAFEIVALDHVTPSRNHADTYTVTGHGGGPYLVDPDGCTCPDSAIRKTPKCKHQMATAIWRKLHTPA